MSHPTGPESRGQNLDAAFKAFGAVGILISVALIVGVLVLTDPFGELVRTSPAVFGSLRRRAYSSPSATRPTRCGVADETSPAIGEEQRHGTDHKRGIGATSGERPSDQLDTVADSVSDRSYFSSNS